MLNLSWLLPFHGVSSSVCIVPSPLSSSLFLLPTSFDFWSPVDSHINRTRIYHIFFLPNEKVRMHKLWPLPKLRAASFKVLPPLTSLLISSVHSSIHTIFLTKVFSAFSPAQNRKRIHNRKKKTGTYNPRLLEKKFGRRNPVLLNKPMRRPAEPQGSPPAPFHHVSHHLQIFFSKIHKKTNDLLQCALQQHGKLHHHLLQSWLPNSLRKKKHAQKTSKVKILKNSLQFFSDLSSSPKKKKKKNPRIFIKNYILSHFIPGSISKPANQPAFFKYASSQYQRRSSPCYLHTAHTACAAKKAHVFRAHPTTLLNTKSD